MQYWQQHFQGGNDEGPATAREAAKGFLHDYVILDWQPKPEYLPSRARGQGWDAQVGGVVEDEAGQPQELKYGQIAITRVQNRPCCSVFELAELIAEIRREEGLEPEAARRCLFCGAVLDNQPRGRDRQYCDNKGKCKQAHHRQKQREERRAALLQEQAELREIWEAQHIEGQLLAMLQDLLIDQGEEAARAATDAVLGYAREQAQEKSQEVKQLEQTIAILKRQLDLEYRYLLDTQARGLVAFLKKQQPSTPLIQKILSDRHIPPMASHATYETYLRRKKLCSEEELAQLKDIWKMMMLEAERDKYLDV